MEGNVVENLAENFATVAQKEEHRVEHHEEGQDEGGGSAGGRREGVEEELPHPGGQFAELGVDLGLVGGEEIGQGEMRAQATLPARGDPILEPGSNGLGDLARLGRHDAQEGEQGSHDNQKEKQDRERCGQASPVTQGSRE